MEAQAGSVLHEQCKQLVPPTNTARQFLWQTLKDHCETAPGSCPPQHYLTRQDV